MNKLTVIYVPHNLFQSGHKLPHVFFYKTICRELSLRSEEDRCSKMREELLTLREDLSKAYLAKDMLEQQKLETDGLISQIEKSKGTPCSHSQIMAFK